MTDNDRDRRNKSRREDEEQDWPRDEELTPLVGDIEEEQLDTIQAAPAGYVMVDTGLDQADTPIGEDEDDDFISVGTNADGVMDAIDDFTTDEEIEEDFAERQTLNRGSDRLLESITEHHSKKPILSGGDIDAAWDKSDVSGEESVGGTAETPDQDVVEELGEAVGIEYEDDEPLDTYGKLRERDRDRWELDPASFDDPDMEMLEEDLEDMDLEDEELPADPEEDIFIGTRFVDLEDDDLDDYLDDDEDLEAED